MIIYENLANAVILEENSVGIGSSSVATSRCIGDFAPVRANDGVILAVPVIGEVVQSPAFVGVDNVVSSACCVNCCCA